MELALFSSVQFSLSVMSNSLLPHGLQHARPPCPSPAPGIYSNSCPLSQWCHPAISSCHPLLLLPSIFPSIRVFSNKSVLRIRWPKYWSFTFNISPSNEYSGLIDCLVRYWVCLGPFVSSFFFIPLGGDRGKESSCQCRYYPWVRKIP